MQDIISRLVYEFDVVALEEIEDEEDPSKRTARGLLCLAAVSMSAWKIEVMLRKAGVPDNVIENLKKDSLKEMEKRLAPKLDN